MNLKEMKMLVKMKTAMGESVDQSILDQIAVEEARIAAEQEKEATIIEERKSAFGAIFNDLAKDIGKLMEEDKKRTAEQQDAVDRFASLLQTMSGRQPAAEEVSAITEAVVKQPAKIDPPKEKSLVEATVSKVSETSAPSMFVQPEPQLVDKDIKAIQQKLKLLEGWVSKIAMTGPGGGEVLFRYLDDVNRNTMMPSNNNWVLEYDAVSKKVQFTDEIGPISSVMFDPNHDSNNHQHPVGTACWDLDDRTLNIIHPDGVIQQVGQELYFLVRNNTGSTITNGMFCGFAGAVGTDGEARLLAAPFIANGTQRNLYGMGVATQDIPHGGEGFITAFGKVRTLNTTGTPVGEVWQLGDVLYAHPSIAGALTRVKPTAPNNVLPVAALVQLSATTGEIFIRPTIEQRAPYARFSDTTTQVAAAINTPYAVTFNTTDISREFTRGTPTSRIIAEVSGLYLYNFTLQISSSSASKKEMWIWARKNGVDVPNSASRISITGNDEYKVVGWGFEISMMDGDYFELMWAVSDTTVSVVVPPQPSFCPTIPSSTLIVTMAAL